MTACRPTSTDQPSRPPFASRGKAVAMGLSVTATITLASIMNAIEGASGEIDRCKREAAQPATDCVAEGTGAWTWSGAS